MISLFKKGLQELSDSNLSQGWELGVHRKPFTMYQEKHWIGTGSSGIFFFLNIHLAVQLQHMGSSVFLAARRVF